MKRIKIFLKQLTSRSLFDFWLIYKKNRQILIMNKAWNQYHSQSKVKNLQIGTGGNIMNGWFNTDIQLEVPGVYFMDAGSEFPMKSVCIDYIYSEHVFEHLTVTQQMNYLRESYRILRPGGKIRIATPDLNKILSLWSENSTFNANYINSNFEVFIKSKSSDIDKFESKKEYVINNYMRDWGHQMIHSKNSLKEMVESIGFHQTKFCEIGVSEDSVFHNIERHFEMIGVENNIFETMIIEAVK